MNQKEKNKPNFAFWGTDEFSLTVLERLKKNNYLPSIVVTVPDQPQGRKMILTPPLVKIWAKENNIDFIQPTNLRELDKDTKAQLNKSYDFFLIASYGKIIPADILNIPHHGSLNIHPSLLPKYRGPSPLETAILNGDEETGVTIMLVDAEMDHGPILAQEKIELKDRYNFANLRDKLATLGTDLLLKILPDYLDNKLKPEEQDHTQATITKKFTKDDGYLDPQTPVISRYRKFLALNPWPGTYFDYPGPQGKIRLIIKEAHLEKSENNEEKIVYDKVIPAGRKEMSWDAFLKGLKSKE